MSRLFSNEDLKRITQWQVARQRAFDSVPPQGWPIEYLGKRFWVYRGVFWPFEDSMPLVEHMRIEREDSVLDVGTGSGVIAVFAAYKGARRVLGTDSSPEAVRCARVNAALHEMESVVSVRRSDMFASVRKSESFDVVTFNPPFRCKTASTPAESLQWDTDLRVHGRFFAGVGRHLSPGGRVYVAQSNFGACDRMRSLARSAGFDVRRIGERPKTGGIGEVFYAFELTRRAGRRAQRSSRLSGYLSKSENERMPMSHRSRPSA